MKDIVFVSKYKNSILCGGLVLCAFLYKCNFSDDYRELSGNYFYAGEGGDKKDIISHLPNKENIYGRVTDYDYNSDFIIAVQMPVYNEYKSMIGFDLRDNLKKYPTNSKQEILKSEMEADSILKHNPYYKSIFYHKINYWIIAHKNKKVYGPLTKEDYLSKSRELKIPDNLKLSTHNTSK